MSGEMSFLAVFMCINHWTFCLWEDKTTAGFRHASLQCWFGFCIWVGWFMNIFKMLLRLEIQAHC